MNRTGRELRWPDPRRPAARRHRSRPAGIESRPSGGVTDHTYPHAAPAVGEGKPCRYLVGDAPGDYECGRYDMIVAQRGPRSFLGLGRGAAAPQTPTGSCPESEDAHAFGGRYGNMDGPASLDRLQVLKKCEISIEDAGSGSMVYCRIRVPTEVLGPKSLGLRGSGSLQVFCLRPLPVSASLQERFALP